MVWIKVSLSLRANVTPLCRLSNHVRHPFALIADREGKNYIDRKGTIRFGLGKKQLLKKTEKSCATAIAGLWAFYWAFPSPSFPSSSLLSASPFGSSDCC